MEPAHRPVQAWAQETAVSQGLGAAPSPVAVSSFPLPRAGTQLGTLQGAGGHYTGASMWPALSAPKFRQKKRDSCHTKKGLWGTGLN